MIERQWTIKEIREMYVEKNYSMILVSKLTHIKLPELSRIIQKFELNKEKEQLYGPNFSGEKNTVPKDEENEFWGQNMDALRSSAEDDFFSGL